MYVSGVTFLIGRTLKSRWFIGAASFLAGAVAAILSSAVASGAVSIIEGAAWLGSLWKVGG
jgi:hypothetical protein